MGEAAIIIPFLLLHMRLFQFKEQGVPAIVKPPEKKKGLYLYFVKQSLVSYLGNEGNALQCLKMSSFRQLKCGDMLSGIYNLVMLLANKDWRGSTRASAFP